MIKKGLLFFILTTGILSCLCKNVLPYWTVTNYDIAFLNDSGEWASTDTVTVDTLDIIVDFNFQYVSEVSFQGFFANTAMATSCENDGYQGMKDPITNITLTANQDFNSFTAGESLNSIVQHNGQEGFQDFVDQVSDFPAVDFFSFRVVEPPMNNMDSLRFNLKLEFSSGLDQESESDNIFWY